MSVNQYDEQVGLLLKGSIHSYDSFSGTIKVLIANTTALEGNKKFVTISAPFGLYYNNGFFVGSTPKPGSPITIGQGLGGEYYFVNFAVEDPSTLPTLSDSVLLLQVNDDTKIELDIQKQIRLGSVEHTLSLDTKNNYSANLFDHQYEIASSHRSFSGVVKRDLKPNSNYVSNKLKENDYFSTYFSVGLDPKTSPSLKNPSFTEKREIVYELAYDSRLSDDQSQSLTYSSKPIDPIRSLPNRRESRADTLSLSLVSPNYLLETIKGTVIDIFGNILDINRYPLSLGSDQATLNPSKSTNLSDSFLKIKEIERKSIAYHFELNARKDPKSTKAIDQSIDYAKDRSRFSFDIDKEGQFKLNVPSSSEKGNVSLFARYENYSSIGEEDNSNPNKLIFREDNLDILHDSIAADKFDSATGTYSARGSVSIKDGDAEVTPLDRLLNSHIKFGTPYHDLLSTCYGSQSNKFLTYQNEEVISLASIGVIDKVMTDTLFVSGDKANVGGRSGTLGFDGSLVFSLGANTSDRQSLLMDMAGAMISNIGRDLYGRSVVSSMDGDFFCQVGGIGVKGDSRFVDQPNGQKGAVFDLRVFTDGYYSHLIRLDKDGVKIMTPGNFDVYAKGDIRLTSGAKMQLEAEELILQNRPVLKDLGVTI